VKLNGFLEQACLFILVNSTTIYNKSIEIQAFNISGDSATRQKTINNRIEQSPS
jgi:hypothetical protein